MSLDSFYTPEKISKPEIFRGYTKRPVKWYGLILKTGNFKNFENYALVWHFKLIKAKKNQRLLFSRIEVCLGLSDKKSNVKTVKNGEKHFCDLFCNITYLI